MIKTDKIAIETDERRHPRPTKTTEQMSLLQAPTTQLAKMSSDPKFVELTADILEILL